MKDQTTPLPKFTKDYLGKISSPIGKQLVCQFHNWLDSKNIKLEQLTDSQIEKFLCQPAIKKISDSTKKVYSVALDRYLVHLFATGRIKYYNKFGCKKFHKFSLPDYTQVYLKTTARHTSKKIILYFHRWAEKRNIDIHKATISQIQDFFDHRREKVGPRRVRTDVKRLLSYFEYLHKKNLFSFNPEFTHFNPKYIEPCLRTFLKYLTINLKLTTVGKYRSALVPFHAYLQQINVLTIDLQRSHFLNWSSSLKARGLRPCSRYSTITCLRVYLRWLSENNLLLADPDEIIRTSDFPKLPIYLPRPLPPEVDQALQNYWLTTKHYLVYARGLWLMRKTGMRIGELESLDYHCVHTDHLGHHFLKVPLGKLNNERLVPITKEMTQIISILQQRKPNPRKYLLSITPHTKSKRIEFYQLIERSERKLKIPFRVQSHQLRHTCATELLNNGMSMTSLMKFLGHTDFRMTLRYAKVNQETILQEFQHATRQAEEKYQLDIKNVPPQSINGLTLISDLIKWCHQNTPRNRQTQTTALIKRLYRIKQDIQKLQKYALSRT